MKPDKRLKKIIEMIPKCSRLMDVGSDHGYIAVEAVRKGIADKAIATDISAASLQKSIDHITLHRLNAKVETRVGDGLEIAFAKDGIDVIVIAGMGGYLIASILKAAEDLLAETNPLLIVQPVQDADYLRQTLWMRGYTFEQESIVLSRKKYYQIFAIRFHVNPRSPLDLPEIPNSVMEEDRSCYLSYLDALIQKYSLVSQRLSYAKETPHEKLDELQYKLNRLKAVKLNEAKRS